MSPPQVSPTEVISRSRIAATPHILTIGNFDDRVTVLTQQKRALNLAWALIESGAISTSGSEKPCRIAILGGGFAGLSFAAALLKKQCRCAITLFEERDTLLPLQQGSDTRWLHPHIYDWPANGSEAVAAMLPVLNWTASRASDVVVQVLSGWSDLIEDRHEATKIELWCNARHLQIRDGDESSVQLEWVGERRDPASGRRSLGERDSEGNSDVFDMVVLAIGFGLESSGFSYWRNEVLGQPGLEQRPTTYLVSGQGDGAIIDVLRLRISQFRQDRILAELFGGSEQLLRRLRALRERFYKDAKLSLYEAFDALAQSKGSAGKQLNQARNVLAQRLRRDTEVILKFRPKVRSVADLLGPGVRKVSFQNAFLLYLLYRCGGFVPASGELEDVTPAYKIEAPYVVIRHGTDRLKPFRRLLPERLYKPIERAKEADDFKVWHQNAETLWPGGYFGTPGRSADANKISDAARAVWRKEYLPGPTALMAATVAGAIASHLLAVRHGTTHLRLTLHRVIKIHGENLLQQCCNYVGTGELDSKPTLARTFPADKATIGLAYQTRKIIRSTPAIGRDELSSAMEELQLNTASRKMAKDVQFVAALPILQPSDRFYGPDPVCAVLYFDSRDPQFDLSNAEFSALSDVIVGTMNATWQASSGLLDRIDNIPLREIEKTAPPASALPGTVVSQLQFVAALAPELTYPFTLNFDHSDLTPLKK